jgi:hypothetical protein
MKKLLIIFFVIGFISHQLPGQKSFSLEASEGFVFFDYFGKEPERFDKIFAGYGLQSEISIWRNIIKHGPIQTKFGFGYTSLYYLGGYNGLFFIARNANSTSYANLKLGFEFQPEWSKVEFIVNSSHYILLHKEKQQNSQNRWFTNLDVGIKFKLFGNFDLSFWSPLTLYPMHDGPKVYRPFDMFGLDFDPYIEVTGLNMGLSYNFGGKE